MEQVFVLVHAQSGILLLSIFNKLLLLYIILLLFIIELDNFAYFRFEASQLNFFKPTTEMSVTNYIY